MKLKTSFFNFTVLRKDLTRFSPLWGLTLIVSLLIIATQKLFYLLQTPDDYAVSLVESISMLPLYQCIFGGLCGLLLFGDLFKSRAAGSLHALPMRREGWFLTHIVAGIVFYLLATVIPNLLDIVFLRKFWYLAFLNMAVEFSIFLFCFGVAAFSAQCAGTRFGAVAVYLLINFFSLLLMFLAQTFYQPQLYGIQTESRVMDLLSPLSELGNREFVLLERDSVLSPNSIFSEYIAEYQGLIAGDWWYLLAVVGAGIVFYVLALLLYRRRHLEKAGNFMTLSPIAVVFLVLLTVSVGAIWFLLGENSYIFLFIGLALGFFPGLMLLEKQLKVFRKKTFFAFGTLALALFVSIGIVRMDPLGVVRYVPEVDEIESATLGDIADSHSFDPHTIRLDTPEELEKLTALHTAFIEADRPNTAYLQFENIYITYHLKNGRQVSRTYPCPEDSALRQQSDQLLSRLDIFESTDMLKRVISIEYRYEDKSMYLPEFEIIAEPLSASGNFDTTAQYKISSPTSLDQNPTALALWEALQKDCLAGTMSQSWVSNRTDIGSLQISYLDAQGDLQYGSIRIFSECSNFRTFRQSLKTN